MVLHWYGVWTEGLAYIAFSMWGCITSRLPHSLEKVVPVLVLQFENDPLFVAKHWLFSSKWPLFRDKTLTFQSKMNPFFCGKNTDFSAQMNPVFHSKTLDIKINPFFSKFTEVSTKIPPFLWKCKSWIS